MATKTPGNGFPVDSSITVPVIIEFSSAMFFIVALARLLSVDSTPLKSLEKTELTKNKNTIR